MKQLKLMLISLLSTLAFSSFAQLVMELTPNQMAYIQYEPIYMHLRIRNDSGRPMVFGKSEKLLAKLFFEVTDIKGNPISDVAPVPIPLSHGKVINPGQVGDIVLRFSNYYKLHQRGSYLIHAYISHPLLQHQFKSNNIRIDIVPGVKVWSRTIGVPDGQLNTAGTTISHDSNRTYSIRKLADGRGQYYYCVLEDAKKVYQVFRLGPFFGSELPKCIVDMSGVLHILINIAPKLYKFYKVDITGELLDQGSYYKTTKTSPSLIKNKDGKIFVTGGAVATPNVDFILRERSYKTMSEL